MRELSELARALCEGSREERDAAARELSHALVVTLGPRTLRGLDRDRVMDVVQDVLLNIVKDPHQYTDKRWGYAVQSLRNNASSRRRRDPHFSGHFISLDGDEAPELFATTRRDSVEVEERWKLLDLAHGHAVELRKREIDRAPLRESWKQIKAIADGQADVRELISLELAPGADARELNRAQNRLHKAHERCRTQLGGAIHALFELGVFKEEDRELALRQHRALVRVAPAPKNRHHADVRPAARRDSTT